jgi:hypothetical protein
MDYPQAITNIEFYTDSELGEETPPPVTTNRTNFSGNVYWDCNSNCYWN